jgi:plasmid stabilization system protein ParE
MKLLFSRRAACDLVQIADYIRQENPAAAQQVRATILESLNILAEFPRLGRLQTASDVRKYVTRKYPYLVYYRIDAAREEIVVLTIQHPARERDFADR